MSGERKDCVLCGDGRRVAGVPLCPRCVEAWREHPDEVLAALGRTLDGLAATHAEARVAARETLLAERVAPDADAAALAAASTETVIRSCLKCGKRVRVRRGETVCPLCGADGLAMVLDERDAEPAASDPQRTALRALQDAAAPFVRYAAAVLPMDADLQNTVLLRAESAGWAATITRDDLRRLVASATQDAGGVQLVVTQIRDGRMVRVFPGFVIQVDGSGGELYAFAAAKTLEELPRALAEDLEEEGGEFDAEERAAIQGAVEEARRRFPEPRECFGCAAARAMFEAEDAQEANPRLVVERLQAYQAARLAFGFAVRHPLRTGRELAEVLPTFNDPEISAVFAAAADGFRNDDASPARGGGVRTEDLVERHGSIPMPAALHRELAGGAPALAADRPRGAFGPPMLDDETGPGGGGLWPAAARAVLGRLEAWTHEFGAALKPPGPDTFGEGVRAAKGEVAALLSGALRGVAERTGADAVRERVERLEAMFAEWDADPFDDADAAMFDEAMSIVMRERGEPAEDDPRVVRLETWFRARDLDPADPRKGWPESGVHEIRLGDSLLELTGETVWTFGLAAWRLACGARFQWDEDARVFWWRSAHGMGFAPLAVALVAAGVPTPGLERPATAPEACPHLQTVAVGGRKRCVRCRLDVTNFDEIL